MPAPQGVGIINSGGEVLDWVLTFDSQADCHEFFDYGLKRFEEYPALEKPVATRRYQPYPNGRREDFRHARAAEPIADRHPEGVDCPATAAAKSRARKGDVAVQIFGRVLDKDGKPKKEVINQEDYSQDHFLITREMQEELAKAVSGNRAEAKMPDRVSRQIIGYAYLSHMDVRPLNNPRGGDGEIRANAFRLHRTDNPEWWRVEGESDVKGEMTGRGGHEHSVKLTWTGYLRLKDGRVSRIVLGARGTERLKFGNVRGRTNRDLELKNLPGGRPIDLDAEVRYGVIGTAVEEDQVRAGEVGKGNNDTGRAPTVGLQQKMGRLQRHMRTFQKRGAVPREVRELMPRFQERIRAGQMKEAEEVLDRLLRVLDRRE